MSRGRLAAYLRPERKLLRHGPRLVQWARESSCCRVSAPIREGSNLFGRQKTPPVVWGTGSARFHPFFLRRQGPPESRHDALMIPLRATEDALHALLPVFRGVRFLSLYEFGRGFVKLFFPLHAYRISSSATLGKLRSGIL